MAAVPEAGLVAPAWRGVQPLVHAPEAVQSTRIGGIGVVDDAVLEHECAHARPLARVGGHVGSGHGRDLSVGPLLPDQRHGRLASVVVFDASLVLLLLGKADVEVEVEVAAERRRPGERPPHPLLVRLQFRERSPRHRAERDVVIGEVDDGAVEAVRDRRAGRTACRVLGPEHEVIDEELRASSEEIGEGRCALVGLEAVLLVDANPGQLLPPPRQFVATPRQRLLGLQQLQPGRKPLLPCSGLVIGHGFLSFLSLQKLGVAYLPMTSHIGGVSPGTDAGTMTISIPSPTMASASGTSMAAFAGRSFWAKTRTAITDIQVTLMTPSATSISISPMLEPTQ